ncbi:aminotransferase class I/II-fold pyridoxal phosphate-dependent enzyme [Streptomyces sp. PG2]
MHGDLCDLPEIVRLAKEHDARVMIDDAHATGVLGERGTGTTEHFGLKGRGRPRTRHDEQGARRAWAASSSARRM